MKLFKAINARGTTIIIATHNREMASFTQRQLMLKEGHLHVVDANPV